MAAKWQEELNRVRHNAALLEEALTAVLIGSAMRVDSMTYDGFKTTAYLINPLRAHGGLILYKQQSTTDHKAVPGVHVAILEKEYIELQSKCGSTDYVSALYNLCGKVKTAAQRALDKATEDAYSQNHQKA